MGKSSEQQRLEKQLAVLKEKFIFLNKVRWYYILILVY